MLIFVSRKRNNNPLALASTKNQNMKKVTYIIEETISNARNVNEYTHEISDQATATALYQAMVLDHAKRSLVGHITLMAYTEGEDGADILGTYVMNKI